MDQEKMGQFIAKLRKEKELTQYDLSELIPVSRDAVSKWECGKRCPEPDCLIKLSEIFDITINELLYGERTTKDNSDDINEVSVKLYDERNKKQKILKVLIVVILLLIFSFLVYYFMNTYNSLKVYQIYYEDENVKITDGILVTTNEKLYFNLSVVQPDYNIEYIELFYKNKNNKEKLVIKTDAKNIIFYDFKGYNSYFDFKYINHIIKNLYLRIYLNNSEKVIKLNYEIDFSNDSLITKQYKSESSNQIINSNNELTDIENKIKNNFLCNYDFCTNTYKEYELIYNLDSRVLNISQIEENKYEYIFNFRNNQLFFQEYDNNNLITKFVIYKGKRDCEIGNCYNIEENIDVFKKIINSIN